jgi:hypothetical protein
MPHKKAGRLTVTVYSNTLFIEVASARAAGLCNHLRSRGVTAAPPSPCSTGTDSIVLGRGTDAAAVQTMLDAWA